jgi:hypothetical protein
MADWSKNITFSVGLFGLGVSTKWGDINGTPYTMVWGTSKWGFGTNTIVFDMEKVVSNNLSSDVSRIFDVTHYYETSFSIESTIVKEPTKFITNSMIISGDMSSEKLSQGGWDYVYPPSTSEIENRSIASWSSGSASTSSYTCQTAGLTTWS